LNASATAAVLVARCATGSVQSMTPVSSTVIAVSVHVPKDTMNTSMTAFSPCCAGRSLCAVP
jgi:hypothetical protein